MANLYCPECGHKNIYTLHSPKFCNACGSGFELETQAKVVKTKKIETKKEKQILEQDSDESNYDYVPDVRGLQYEISHAEGANIYSGKDILGMNDDDLKQIKKSRGKKKENKVRRPNRRN
tara:strand:+ start:334 stop:693 length:360 start_codon:yes stop_codon:yes gene_type:complete